MHDKHGPWPHLRDNPVKFSDKNSLVKVRQNEITEYNFMVATFKVRRACLLLCHNLFRSCLSAISTHFMEANCYVPGRDV